MTNMIKRLLALAAIICGVFVLWASISILGYETTFERDQLDGLKKGMSRVEVATVLKHADVAEMESEPATTNDMGQATLAVEWVDLRRGDFAPVLYRHEIWRYHVPDSYSTVDLRFTDDKLVSILYRWRPFEG